MPNLVWIGRHIFRHWSRRNFRFILVNSSLRYLYVSFLFNLGLFNAILINSRPLVLSWMKKSAKNETESIHS